MRARNVVMIIVALAMCVLAWSSDGAETAKEATVGHAVQRADASTPDQSRHGNTAQPQVEKGRRVFADAMQAAIVEARQQEAYDRLPLNEDKLARTPWEHEAAGMTMLGLYAAGQYSAWFYVADTARESNPDLSRRAKELGVKLAIAGRPFAKVDLPALLNQERAMLKEVYQMPEPSPKLATLLSRMSASVEAMASGNGPSVAARLEHEAQQPIGFQRRVDDDEDVALSEE